MQVFFTRGPQNLNDDFPAKRGILERSKNISAELGLGERLLGGGVCLDLRKQVLKPAIFLWAI
jgi:hypothetical protein